MEPGQEWVIWVIFGVMAVGAIASALVGWFWEKIRTWLERKGWKINGPS